MARDRNKGHVSDVLAEVFRRGGMKRAVKRAESVLLWPQVVGAELSRFTEAKSLKDGVLFVEVPDSETSMHLMLQRQRFLDKYRGKFNVREVRDIQFRVGRPRILEDEPVPPPPPPVDAKELARYANTLAALDLPDSLTQPAMQAAKALLSQRKRKLAAGWTECIICHELIETGDTCGACQRYAAELKVIRASHILAVNPSATTPLLSEDELAVARHLAKSYLQERLQDLLPYVLADATFKPQLEAVARCYAAHELGKEIDDVTEADLDILDARVARALGRWK